MLSPHLPVLEACTFTLDCSDSSSATTNIVTFDLLFILFYFIGFYLYPNASLCVGVKFLNKAENPHPLSDLPKIR